MVHVFWTCHTTDPKEERGEEKMKWERKKKDVIFFLFCLSQRSFGGLPEPKDSGKLSQSFSNSYASCWS
jgi:hypothetical protein